MGYEVKCEGGETYQGKFVVFATGICDILPEVLDFAIYVVFM
jgi:hypothetical protein